MDNAQALTAKIRALPPSRLSEVEDFIDLIAAQEPQRTLTRAAAVASAPAFAMASAIKLVFATVEQALIIRKLGELVATDQATLKQAIWQTIG